MCAVRRIFLSSKNYSKKKLLKPSQKDVAKTQGLPPKFLKQLEKWPKLLECEIEAGKHNIQEFLVESDNDWTELEMRGFVLRDLRFSRIFFDSSDGKIATFDRRSKLKKSGDKVFRRGCPVSICEEDTLKSLAEAIFLRAEANEFYVKLMSNVDSLSPQTRYALIPSAEIGVLQSLKDNLNIRKIKKYPGVRLLGMAFNDAPMPSIHNDKMSSDISDSLNVSQKKAIAAALNNKRPFMCIQGPPGTGKTRVVAEIIKILSNRNKKILVCAPSNIAVDNALNHTLRLLKEPEDVDFSIMDEEFIDSQSISEALKNHPDYTKLEESSQKIIETVDQKERKIHENNHFILKNQIYAQVCKSRKVIFCTLTSGMVQKLKNYKWKPDVLIIDEAAMCIEPQAWVAILTAKRCILVGDHCQLPAVVHSTEARKEDLNVSLMERLCDEYSNSNISFLLCAQYRMNEAIMRWSSDNFYDSRLTSHETVANIKLSDISVIPEDHSLNYPMIFVDTSETDNSGETKYRLSYQNHVEAKFIGKYVNFLLESGVSPKSIGIITPYYAQAQVIKDHLWDNNIAVSTVDRFQGQEKEVILFSLVRDNPGNILGFLRDSRRMNVAVTRAKRQFCLVGNRRMMTKDKNLRSLLNYMISDGKIYKHNYIESIIRPEKGKEKECVA